MMKLELMVEDNGRGGCLCGLAVKQEDATEDEHEVASLAYSLLKKAMYDSLSEGAKAIEVSPKSTVYSSEIDAFMGRL